MYFKKILMILLCVPLLAGCAHEGGLYENRFVEPAHINDRTRATVVLESLPAPARPVAVVSYDFQDQTGQFKYNDKYTDYSSAVTKGGEAILINALMDAGRGNWFDVVERGGLKDLLQERQIIKVMRGEYLGKNGQKLSSLPPLMYGGLLLEGGIISYDSNTITGGLGATYLGIGGDTQYHRDIVTVYLRGINVQTGKVMLAVTSSKTLYSVAVDANILKYITFDRLFQAEAGFTVTEPTELAVRQAIETAVYSLVMEGSIKHMWEFKDKAEGRRAIRDYLRRRDRDDDDSQDDDS